VRSPYSSLHSLLCSPPRTTQAPSETPNYSGHFLGDFGAATLAFAFLQAFMFLVCVGAVLLRRHKAMKRRLKKMGLDKEAQNDLVPEKVHIIHVMRDGAKIDVLNSDL
jgi:hypothetical protein